MYTQCPECLSVFSLDARALSVAHGQVICGYCEAEFDSAATLAEQLPAEPFAALPINPTTLEPCRLERLIYRPQIPSPTAAPADAPAAASTLPDAFSGLVFAPRFTRDNGARKLARKNLRNTSQPRPRRWPWVLVCLMLALLLGGQLAWAERDVLISNPRVGSWLRSSCAALHCRLPLVAAPQKIQLLARQVQAHAGAGAGAGAGAAGALMISAKIRNDAAFAQPWPIITLTFSNAQGQRVGMRRLHASDYLDDRKALHRGLSAGASAVVLLEVVDPEQNAVNFTFSFE